MTSAFGTKNVALIGSDPKEIKLASHRICLRNELWVHFAAAYGERQHSWMVRGNDPDNFVKTTSEAIDTLHIDLPTLETELAHRIVRHRHAWLLQRIMGAGGPPPATVAPVMICEPAVQFSGDLVELTKFMAQTYRTSGWSKVSWWLTRPPSWAVRRKP